MLGRKTYTEEELDHATTAVDRQLGAHKTLVEAGAPLDAFDPLFFNNMILVLDRYFVHRVRAVTGKDGNPLNEVELLADSLMNNDGVLRGNNVIKYKPDESVVKLEIGDRIALSAAQFERLAEAFLAEIRTRFR